MTICRISSLCSFQVVMLAVLGLLLAGGAFPLAGVLEPQVRPNKVVVGSLLSVPFSSLFAGALTGGPLDPRPSGPDPASPALPRAVAGFTLPTLCLFTTSHLIPPLAWDPPHSPRQI